MPGQELGKPLPFNVNKEFVEVLSSVDGPEAVHDAVRGVPGSFRKTKENIALLQKLEEGKTRKISKSICFTIIPYSYKGLGEMPDVVRSMGIQSINIVPYYYVPEENGKQYENELRRNFDCDAFSWKGFHHEDSGIDFDLFKEQLNKYNAGLNGLKNDPYMPLSDEEYRTWFTDATTPIGSPVCSNVENLIDIQPDGSANFCVDFPDFSFGNVRESTIHQLWNSPEAEAFRIYRRKQPLPVCSRCGARHMSKF